MVRIVITGAPMREAFVQVLQGTVDQPGEIIASESFPTLSNFWKSELRKCLDVKAGAIKASDFVRTIIRPYLPF